MSPSRKETPASASAHQERVRRATAEVFANAAAHNADSPPLPGSSPGPPSGWVNDPSGLIYFRNRSHIFTNTPHTAPHSALSTGHAASADPLHWEHPPLALAPGDPHVKDGCFPGCALEHNRRLPLIYTGHGVLPHGPFHEAAAWQAALTGFILKNTAFLPQALHRMPRAICETRRSGKRTAVGSCGSATGGMSLMAQSAAARRCAQARILKTGPMSKAFSRTSAFRPRAKRPICWNARTFSPWMARAFCCARRKGLCLAAAICGISLKTAVSPGPKNLSFSPGPAFRELHAGHDFHAAQTLAAPDGVLERHLIRGRTRMGEEAA